MKLYPMNTDQLVRMLEQGTFDGIIDADCTKCGCTITVEPDAWEAFCDTCDEVTPVLGLAALGFI